MKKTIKENCGHCGGNGQWLNEDYCPKCGAPALYLRKMLEYAESQGQMPIY